MMVLIRVAQACAPWYIWREYTEGWFVFYPIIKAIGCVMDFFRTITPNAKISVSWSGTNFHK